MINYPFKCVKLLTENFIKVDTSFGLLEPCERKLPVRKHRPETMFRRQVLSFHLLLLSGEHIGQAKNQTSDLLFSSLACYRLRYKGSAHRVQICPLLGSKLAVIASIKIISGVSQLLTHRHLEPSCRHQGSKACDLMT